MQDLTEAVYYGDYLQLDKLLDAQSLRSKAKGRKAHEETLFIIVHQVYELWFKQILHELHSIHQLFSQSTIPEDGPSVVVARLERIKKIQGLLVDQLGVMETMTPMDFLDFRDLLVPASGFQSVQFREIEVLLGLKTNQRHGIDREYFVGRLSERDRKKIEELEAKPSLLDLIEKWLERLPFVKMGTYDFWKSYELAVKNMLDEDEKIITDNLASLDKKSIDIQLSNLKVTRQTFASLFDKKQHDELIRSGSRRLSQSATLNALFILLFRDRPILHLPYLVINSLIDIDENFTSWRYRHAIMAHRLLGTKIGTGGSSGHHYLKSAAENNRAFRDFFDLSTFLLPKNSVPVLPEEILKNLDFWYQGKGVVS